MSDTNITRTETDAIREAIQELAPTEVLTAKRGNANEVQFFAKRTRNGVELTSVKPFLDAYLTAPERRKGIAKAQDMESFIGLVNRYKDDSSVIFCNLERNAPHLLGILNYNEIGATSSPRFGDHCVLYKFPLAEEWQLWVKSNGSWFELEDFAEFLEDRILDVIDPSQIGDAIKQTLDTLDCAPAGQSQLMSLSRGLKVKVDRDVSQAINLQSGETQVNFEEKHGSANGGPLVVPGAFVIGIPVFVNGDLYQIAARLRYRVSGGSISWKYDLHRHWKVFDFAVTEARKTAQDQTKCPIYCGSPES